MKGMRRAIIMYHSTVRYSTVNGTVQCVEQQARQQQL